MKPEKDASDIVTISEAMTRMRILVGRRVVTRLAVERMGNRLDLTHADVIKTVRFIARDGEVTVGAVADYMRIDPSRASRLISELVDRNMLRRSVSQEDARRAVIELTDEASDYFIHSEAVKHGLIRKITEDWSQEDVGRFADLFARFSAELDALSRMTEMPEPQTHESQEIEKI